MVFIFFLIFSDIFFFFSYKVIFPTIFFVSGKNNCQCLKKNGGYFMPVPPARPGDCQGQEPGVLCFIFEAQNLLCASCMSGE